jgi:hypothetical protein
MSPVDSEENLVSLIVEAAATIGQQHGIFERTRRSPLRRCHLCFAVGGRRLNICSKLVRNTIFFFKNTSVVFLDFQTQSDPI